MDTKTPKNDWQKNKILILDENQQNGKSVHLFRLNLHIVTRQNNVKLQWMITDLVPLLQCLTVLPANT